jgi:hypothetical protein
MQTPTNHKPVSSAQDILHTARKRPLDAIFRPKVHRAHWCDGKSGQRRADRVSKSRAGRFPRRGLSHQSQAQLGSQSVKAYPSYERVAGESGSRRHLHTGQDRPGHHSRLRQSRNHRRGHHQRRLQRNRSGRRGARKTNPHRRPCGGMRIVGPNCLGVMMPHLGLERHVRHHHRQAGQRRLPQSERRAVHGGARLVA